MTTKTFDNIPNKQVEDLQGKRHWISRSVAVVVIPFFELISTGDIYIPLGKRSTNMNLFPGAWGLVAGFLDWNESAQECVKREVWEELGLDLDEFGEVPEQPSYVYSLPNAGEGETVSLRFVVKYKVNELPVLNPQCDEVADTLWYPIRANIDTLYIPLALDHKELLAWGASHSPSVNNFNIPLAFNHKELLTWGASLYL